MLYHAARFADRPFGKQRDPPFIGAAQHQGRPTEEFVGPAALERQEKLELVRRSPTIAHIGSVEADSRDRHAEGKARIDRAGGIEEWVPWL